MCEPNRLTTGARNANWVNRVAVLVSGAIVGLTAIAALAQQKDDGTQAATSIIFSADQVTRGRSAYERGCVDCHGATLDNGEFGGPPLRGASFLRRWNDKSVADLYAYTKDKMPADRPGTLSGQTYVELVAFILQANGYKAGPDDLTTDSTAQALMRLRRD